MICVEDVLDSLNWVESVGGTKELIKISNENLKIVEIGLIVVIGLSLCVQIKTQDLLQALHF